MPDEAPGPSELLLLEHFPPVATADWESAILADLNGADYARKLVWNTDEGITVEPYYRAENLPGTLPRPLSTSAWEIAEALPAGEMIDAAAFHEAGATAVQELACAMAAASDRLASGQPPADFVFAIGSDYFFEIAKFRAARLLWMRLREVYSSPADVRIHAVTSLANKSVYSPYSNLLRATTESLSAVIGGCDSLIVRPACFSRRLALNVQRILKEESNFDKVADPAGGSYFIESLTHALAGQSWELFRQIEAQGGWAKYQSAGLADAAITASRLTKEEAFATRRRVLVGVNNYPDLGERALDESTALDGGRWRLATPIEEIRLRTERHVRRTGACPSILLLKRGDPKMRTARASFCLNFFGCAGFALEESENLAAAQPDLIVLCSSDSEYLDLAREICPAVRVPVLVAGNPKDHIEALRQAGVVGFVHAGSSLVETLSEWQQRLGVRA